MRQLVFDLARPPSFDPDDFLESASNLEAATMVARWPNWPERVVLLVGPSGCGKSHLGSIWAAQAGGRTLGVSDQLDIETASPIVVFLDDCDRTARSEAELFHLLNMVREHGGWVLAAARTPPNCWGIRTPDLLSRLRLAPTITIGRPDPSLIRAVIVKLFADRQIHIEEDVVAYASRHCEQSLEAINRFVAAVDDDSLAAGRRVTRFLAARTLAGLDDEPAALDDEVQDRNQGPT